MSGAACVTWGRGGAGWFVHLHRMANKHSLNMNGAARSAKDVSPSSAFFVMVTYVFSIPLQKFLYRQLMSSYKAFHIGK